MTFVVVTFTAEGFHHWPQAPAPRAYLATRHRHLFHVRVEVEAVHSDREIECHDLRDFCVEAFGSGDMGSQSCEMMAEGLAKITRQFGDRRVKVEVMEDGEVGGSLVIGPVGRSVPVDDQSRGVIEEEKMLTILKQVFVDLFRVLRRLGDIKGGLICQFDRARAVAKDLVVTEMAAIGLNDTNPSVARAKAMQSIFRSIFTV